MAELKEWMFEKFCFTLGKTAAETITVLKEAFKDDTTGKAQVYDWCYHLKRGEISREDHPRSGHPSMSRPDRNAAKVCQAVLVGPLTKFFK